MDFPTETVNAVINLATGAVLAYASSQLRAIRERVEKASREGRDTNRNK